MILVDSRVGSKHLAGEFDSLGVGYELTQLEFGDCSWLGKSDSGPVAVGVELKNVNDLLNSIQSGRLSGHQVPGLLDRYQHVWLVVEGVYRSRRDGLVEVLQGRTWTPLVMGRRRPVYYSEIEGYLTTLAVEAGIHTKQTGNAKETARFIELLYTWWQKDKHTSLQTIYQPKEGGGSIRRESDWEKRMKLTAKGLQPGFGWERVKGIVGEFDSVADMINASEDRWKEIPGIGKKLAADVVAGIRQTRS